MLVEDDADIRETIVELLEHRGYRTLSAEDGQRGLERLRAAERKPCLILLDLTMPVMNGWEFLAAKADDAALATIPVVVLSAVASVEQRDGRERWAGILMKPISLQTLMETVEKFGGRP